MTDNIINFPREEQPELLIGPFEVWKVQVEGRIIPGLTGRKRGEVTELIVDSRFGVDVPNDLAPQVAWLIANAMAVAQGYTHLGAASRDARPFAPIAVGLTQAVVGDLVE